MQTEIPPAPRTRAPDQVPALVPGRRVAWPAAYLAAGATYLALAVAVWWHVWTGHPSMATTCGCGDPSAAIWYTSWPAYAISHGLNPLYSRALGYPTGVNLVFSAYGIVLAPLTWWFGPVAALNVALTLSPVLSALAMFALVRRWTTWAPAAWAAGLLYGFSPFVLSNVASAHIDLAMVAIPPLIVACLDELLVRQRRRLVPTGVLLGLLVAAEVMIGTEVVVLVAIEAAIGLAAVVVYASRRQPAALRARARAAAPALAYAGLTAVALLVVPLGFALAGPAHFTGNIHPGVNVSSFQAPLRSFFEPPRVATRGAFSTAFYRIVGGYQGEAIAQQYLGAGLLVVCAAGTIVFRRERLLWLFGIVALSSLLLANSAGSLFTGFPVLGQIVPVHFVLPAVLAGAVMLGVIVDRTRDAAGLAWVRRAEGGRGAAGPSRWVGALAGAVVAVVALVPLATYLSGALPLTVEPIVLPAWFRTVAPRLTGSQVVLPLPAPFALTRGGLTWTGPDGVRYPLAISGKEAAMTWQALDGQRPPMVGPGGLGAGIRQPAGTQAGQDVLSAVTYAYGAPPAIGPAQVAAVRRALRVWGVTTVVLPDQPELPAYDRVASAPQMAALVSAATGTAPRRVAGAWVWQGVGRQVPSGAPSASAYRQCTSAGGAPVPAVAACVLSAEGAPAAQPDLRQ